MSYKCACSFEDGPKDTIGNGPAIYQCGFHASQGRRITELEAALKAERIARNEDARDYQSQLAHSADALDAERKAREETVDQLRYERDRNLGKVLAARERAEAWRAMSVSQLAEGNESLRAYSDELEAKSQDAARYRLIPSLNGIYIEAGISKAELDAAIDEAMRRIEPVIDSGEK